MRALLSCLRSHRSEEEVDVESPVGSRSGSDALTYKSSKDGSRQPRNRNTTGSGDGLADALAALPCSPFSADANIIPSEGQNTSKAMDSKHNVSSTQTLWACETPRQLLAHEDSALPSRLLTQHLDFDKAQALHYVPFEGNSPQHSSVLGAAPFLSSSPCHLTSFWLGNCAGFPVAYQNPLSLAYFGDLRSALPSCFDSCSGICSRVMPVLQQLFSLEGRQLMNEMLVAVLDCQAEEGNAQGSWRRVMRVPASCSSQTQPAGTSSGKSVHTATTNAAGQSQGSSTEHPDMKMMIAVETSDAKGKELDMSEESAGEVCRVCQAGFCANSIPHNGVSTGQSSDHCMLRDHCSQTFMEAAEIRAYASHQLPTLRQFESRDGLMHCASGLLEVGYHLKPLPLEHNHTPARQHKARDAEAVSIALRNAPMKIRSLMCVAPPSGPARTSTWELDSPTKLIPMSALTLLPEDREMQSCGYSDHLLPRLPLSSSFGMERGNFVGGQSPGTPSANWMQFSPTSESQLLHFPTPSPLKQALSWQALPQASRRARSVCQSVARRSRPFLKCDCSPADSADIWSAPQTSAAELSGPALTLDTAVHTEPDCLLPPGLLTPVDELERQEALGSQMTELRPLEEKEHFWHEVYISRVKDASGRDLLLISQIDTTTRTHLETAMSALTEALLNMMCQIFPRHFIEHMCMSGGNPSSAPHLVDHLARSHNDVSILFMDIVGFTTMSKQVPPAAVMKFLNGIFSVLDTLSEKHNVQKVETAGDCYIVAAGILSIDQEGFSEVNEEHDAPQSAAKILAFAKDMLAASRKVLMPHDGSPLCIRIGIHTGECVSGMVGSRMPKFSIFGDTMNTASRMESTCTPGRIQISSATHALLMASGKSSEHEWDATGGVEVKGKGVMETFVWREPVDRAPSSVELPSPSPASSLLMSCHLGLSEWNDMEAESSAVLSAPAAVPLPGHNRDDVVDCKMPAQQATEQMPASLLASMNKAHSNLDSNPSNSPVSQSPSALSAVAQALSTMSKVKTASNLGPSFAPNQEAIHPSLLSSITFPTIMSSKARPK